jgi:polysaccharide biosynthesis protein PelA
MKLTIFAALSSLLMPMVTLQTPPIRWAAYYSQEASANLNEFDLLILDSDSHPPLAPLSKSVKTLLANISIGEVGNNRVHFGEIKSAGILIGENEVRKGSYFVDVRDRRWTDRVTKLVGEAVRNGFQGVFLDTVDDAALLEARDPRKYAGMQDAMASLIVEVRHQFPSIKIAVNRGYTILPKIDKSLDFVLGESIYADFDVASNAYARVSTDRYNDRVGLLSDIMHRNPKLRVLTLDYWNSSDAAGIERIYRTQKANGFSPYVAAVNLNRIVLEPRQ